MSNYKSKKQLEALKLILKKVYELQEKSATQFITTGDLAYLAGYIEQAIEMLGGAE
jgi:hypothetical protein